MMIFIKKEVFFNAINKKKKEIPYSLQQLPISRKD